MARLRRSAPSSSIKLKKIFKKIANIVRKGTAQSDRRRAAIGVAASALGAIEKLAQPVRLTKANLHEYRLTVKELHSLVQMSESADQHKFVEYLAEVKDAIGEWHDWQELVAFAKEILGHGANCKLIHELETNATAHYQKALITAKALRGSFLREALGVPLYPGGTERGKEVWQAAAALVG